MFQPTRWTARAACLTAAAVPILLASAAPSFAVEGGVNPVATPLTFPGTSTQVHGWKLTGTGNATNVQVAPRWVISSKHAGLKVGATYRAPLGQTSKVIAYYQPAQASPGSWSGSSDISVSLLETSIAAPTGGFPKLLTDPITIDLQSVLPGYVLWSGQGATTAAPIPSAGWAKANSTSFAGSRVLSMVGGDSGSAGFLYPTATSRPLMPGVVNYASTRPGFGGDVMFSDPLGPSSTESFATVADWAKAQFAKHSTATAPAFTTFSGGGVSFSALRPMAPRGIKATSATPTSVSLAWTHPKDTRVSRTGYRVKISPSNRVVNLAASASTYTATGLSTGVDYTFTVKAVNAKGESPVAVTGSGAGDPAAPDSAFLEPDNVKYKTRTAPGAVQGLTVSAEGANGTNTALYGGGKSGADYCLVARWSAAAPGAGSTITRYETRIDGVLITPAPDADGTDRSIVAGEDGTFSAKRCGLQPSTAFTIQVIAKSDLSAGPAREAAGTTIAGPPAGTAFTKPVLTLISVSTATGERCITPSWSAPAEMTGFPVKHYSVLLHTTNFSYSQGSEELGSDARSTTFCGVPAGRDFKVTVYADRGWDIVTSTSDVFSA